MSEDRKTLYNPIAIERARETEERRLQELIRHASQRPADRQAERERVAREWLYERGWILRSEDLTDVQALANLLASTEARVLEEAAQDCRDQARVYDGRELMKRNVLIGQADYFDAKAKERRG